MNYIYLIDNECTLLNIMIVYITHVCTGGSTLIAIRMEAIAPHRFNFSRSLYRLNFICSLKKKLPLKQNSHALYSPLIGFLYFTSLILV